MIKIKAALTKELKKPVSFEIETVNMVDPREGEVRVKLVGSGICHTDIGYAANEFLPAPVPMVMGHEGAGIVESVGPGVTRAKVGDHVVISNPSCGKCEQCKAKREWLCDKAGDFTLLAGGKDYFGTTYMTTEDGGPVYVLFSQGGFAEYVTTNQQNVSVVNEKMDLRIAGPLGCGLRTGAACVKAVLQPKEGEWVLVNGGGAVGMGALWYAKAIGAKVCVSDVNEGRLEMAKETGADVVFNPKGMSPEEVTAGLKEAMDGKGAHFMVEASGFAPSIMPAIAAVRLGGIVAQAGVAGALNLDSWFFSPCEAKTVTWVRMGNTNNDDIIPELCDLYVEGKFPFDRLITFYKFEDIQQAIDDAIAGKAIKPVLLFD